jgi:4-amino-4-deoxy-L-arabinose transferase-like glycosyltransferase
MSDRLWWRRLGLLAALGLAVRVGYVLGWRLDEVAGDSVYYHQGANLLADGHGFILPQRFLLTGQQLPGADHPPGYLVVLALGSIVGLRSFLDHQLLSCLLGTATVIALGWTTRRMVSRQAGLIAAGVAAVYPNFWFYDGIVLSETLILLTTTLSILASLRAWEHPTPARLGQLGLVLGIAALSRSESILLAPLIIVPLLWWARSRARHNLVLLGGVAALAILAVVGPWVAYNLSRFDRPVTLAATPEIALAVSNCDAVYYGPNVGYWSEQCAADDVHGAPDDDAVRAAIFKDRGLSYLKEHASRLPVVVLARLGRTWGFWDPSGQLRLDENLEVKEPLPATFALFMYYALAGLAVVGALLLRSRRIPIFFLVAFAVNVSIASVLVFGQTRFRAAAEPSIVLMAAAAIDNFWLRSRRLRDTSRLRTDVVRDSVSASA